MRPRARRSADAAMSDLHVVFVRTTLFTALSLTWLAACSGTAHAPAGAHGDPDLAVARGRVGQLDRPERASRSLEHHGSHRVERRL